MRRRRFLGMLVALPATRLVPYSPTRPVSYSRQAPDPWSDPVTATPIEDVDAMLAALDGAYSSDLWRWLPVAAVPSVEFRYHTV